MRPKIVLSMALLAATATLTAAACGSSSSGSATTPSTGGAGGAASSKPYDIAFIGPTSGPYAFIGNAQLAGLRAGITVVNGEGGIGGRQIKLSVHDDQADPTQAAPALARVLSGGTKPDMVYPGITSPEALAMLPTLTQDKILSFAGIVSNETDIPSKYPYFFSIGQNQLNAYRVLAKYALSKGLTSIAYLRPDSPSGKTDVGQMIQAGQESGVKVTDVLYSPTALDLTTSMQKALDSKPKLLVLDAYGPSAGYLLQARTKLNVSVPTVGALIFAIGNPGAYVPASQLQGVTLEVANIIKSAGTSQTPALSTFLSALKVQTPTITQSLNLYSGPYDVIEMLKLAAAQAKSTTTEAMATALQNFTQPAVKPYVTYGQISFTATEHQVTPPESDYSFVPAAVLTDGQYPAS